VNSARGRSGQIALLMLLLLTAALLVVLVCFDVFTAVLRKNDTQNAGDAAALAAARWQAASLNLEGELNLLHALALATGETNAVRGINAIQERLAFAGPLAGLAAAQTAARENHAFDDPQGEEILRAHASALRSLADPGVGAGSPDLLYPEPWPGAWREYADMIETVAAGGIAAVPGNTRYFDAAGGHILLERAFYMAVNGRDWCWFFFNAMPLLRGYRSFSDWPPLPEPDESDFSNSEIFGLGIRPAVAPLVMFMDETAAAEFLSAVPPGETIDADALRESGVMTNAAQKWYVYDRAAWGRWEKIDPQGEYRFPAAGRVKPEYDVDGAAAVCRVRADIDPSSPGLPPAKAEWLAAAKPFGYLEEPGGGRRETAVSLGGYVMPAFRAVRLVPVDTARGAEFNTADASWVEHVRRHIRPYMERGPSGLPPAAAGCVWCDALRLWEQAAFREYGLRWLEVNSGTCRRGGGGPGGHGGSAHGH